jgi:hypothetical protein
VFKLSKAHITSPKEKPQNPRPKRSQFVIAPLLRVTKEPPLADMGPRTESDPERSFVGFIRLAYRALVTDLACQGVYSLNQDLIGGKR